MISKRSATLLVTWAVLCTPARADDDALEIRKGDHVVFLGNTFAERLHLFGYFETFLHSRFPGHRLVVRNLGWSGDEVDLMPRPRGFGDLHAQLRRERADLVFACFGLNESFAGAPGLARFRAELERFLEGLLGAKFNGTTPPRIVLVSPIAHERPEDRLPDPRERNESLRLYTKAMAKVAARRAVTFIDLFTPTLERESAGSSRKLTFNGIHLTEFGYWFVSQLMARQLGLIDSIPPPADGANRISEDIRRIVYEKNYQHYFWWRAPNASYIHGGRNRSPGARRLPQERKLQVKLIDAGDRKIWASRKPDPAGVWRRTPVDGSPIWFPTPASVEIPGGGDLPAQTKGDPGPSRSPAQTLRALRVPKGYRVNLFASEIDFPIANPVALTFDPAGRLWVANSPTWPHPLPGKQPTDSIVILEDTDRDGVADKHSVFLDRLDMVHGFELADGGAYVSQAPNMIFARDANGDGRADWIRMVLHGFGTEDVEHAMNNFRWSPGGSIFLTQGIFYHTQVETPYGPQRVRDAAVFRYRPREHRLEVFVSHHFWNPYGNLFDRWGRGIVLDASAGQCYPMDCLSSNYIYPKRKKRADHLSFGPGGGIAAGCDFIENRHFPPEVQGRFLVNECVGNLATHWLDVESVGSIFKTKKHDPALLGGKDPTYRPVAMAFGPDGALYVVDFHSHIFENVQFAKRNPGRDHTHGRIWRITHENRPLVKAPLTRGAPIAGLLDLLKARDRSTRDFARRELCERKRPQVIEALRAWVARLDASDKEREHHLLEALWVHQGVDVVNAPLLRRLLQAEDPRARAAATRVLRYWQGRIDGSVDLLRARVDDADPRVRLEAVLACGFSTSTKASEIALEAAKHPMDPGIQLALDQTLRYFERHETDR